jgi:hypothetical protein
VSEFSHRRCANAPPDTPSSASPIPEEHRSYPATRNQHGLTTTAGLNPEHLTIGQVRQNGRVTTNGGPKLGQAEPELRYRQSHYRRPEPIFLSRADRI